MAYEVRTQTGWTALSWREFGHQCDSIAERLIRLGIQKGDRCGILVSTRVEWIAIDFGILCAGGATTTIYPEISTSEDCWYILHDAKVRVCFVENSTQLQKVLDVWERLPELEHIVLVEGSSPMQYVHAYSEWTDAVPDREGVDARVREVSADDLACLIYASGTTGTPKGVMLSHHNFLRIAEAVGEQAQAFEDEKQYLFLPLAHVFGKVCELTSVYLGVPTSIDGDIERLVESMGDTQPTVMAAVPRVFEKCFNLIVRRARNAGPKKVSRLSVGAFGGASCVKIRQRDSTVPFLLKVQFSIADRLVYSKVRAVFGGRLRTCISGGAPLAVELAEFFHACDILVLEGYGLTETSAVTTINQPHKYRFGSVGQAAPGVSLKIAEDGEILIRSGAFMSGYFLANPWRQKRYSRMIGFVLGTSDIWMMTDFYGLQIGKKSDCDIWWKEHRPTTNRKSNQDVL